MSKPFSAARNVGMLVLSLGLLIGCGNQSGETENQSPLGALDPYLQSATDDTWTQIRDGGKFTLVNDANPNLVRRFFLDVDETVFGRRNVSVDVSIDEGSNKSRAGLVFGVRPNAKNYYIYVLEADQMVAVYRRVERRQEELIKAKNDSIENDRAKLTIREDNQRLFFQVNGQQIGVLDMPEPDRGAAGIIAWGKGRFTFTDFDHFPALKAKPAPSDAPAQ